QQLMPAWSPAWRPPGGPPPRPSPPSGEGHPRNRPVAAEKRVVFRSPWLPLALLAPQAAVIGIFFFWPAAQTLLQSFQQQDAFGTSTSWVGLENFVHLFQDRSYIESFKTPASFSISVAAFGIAISLLLASFADRAIRGALVYKTLLIWPY